MRQTRRRNLLALVALLLIIIIFCFKDNILKKQQYMVYENLKNTYQDSETTTSEKELPDDQELIIQGEGTADKKKVDFERLQEINSDIYAWIEIPDTTLSYPIVQDPDSDDYYLNHTVEKKEGLPGSIYTERCNAKDFSDFNTVIYGHNMLDGTMFGSLRENRDLDYLMQHQMIYIYLPGETRVYQIFAAVVYDDRLITATYDESIKEDREAFLASIYGVRDLNSHILEEIDVTSEDQLITLSTCIHDQEEKRYLVEGVLVDVIK